MVLRRLILAIAIACITSSAFLFCASNGAAQTGEDDLAVNLPEPRLQSEFSLEECLATRRSVRSYADRPLTSAEISQVLWAAQGITSDWGGRTAPSAGALYPLRLYLVVGVADDLAPGVYEYHPQSHSLSVVKEGDFRRELMSAALSQGCVGAAPACLVITAIPSVTAAKYGNRAMRYIDTEVGAVCQNVYLQCQALGLGTVAIGAFDDPMVAEIVSTDADPRLLMPFGPR